MPREHWTTVRRTTSPLFTWLLVESRSHTRIRIHTAPGVEKPLCCFPRFSLDGRWTTRRISFDLIDRRSLLVVSSSWSLVKSRSTLSRNWPERSRNVVYLRLTRLVWVVFIEYEQSGERNAFVYIQPFSSRRSRPRQRTTSPLFEGQIVQGRSSYRPSGSVEFSLPPSLTFSFFLALVSRSVGSSSWWDYEGDRAERGRNWTITLLRFDSFATCYTYTCCTLLWVNI